MSQLQIVEGTRPHADSNHTNEAVAEASRSDSYRKALYESLRQRDAWLRKAWGRASHIVVEFQ